MKKYYKLTISTFLTVIMLIQPLLLSNYADQPNLGNIVNTEPLPFTQTNNITQQSNYDQYVWDDLNLTGDSNASIAILSTGIDDEHVKFGRGAYDDLNFSRKIVGWQDFTDESSITPVDKNGEGTFIASSAFGSNESDAAIQEDAQNRISATLTGKYYHPSLFEDSLSQDYFEISLGTFLIDQPNTNVSINATFTEYNDDYIEDAVVRLYYGTTSILETSEIIDSSYKAQEVNLTTNLGLFDVRFRYRSVGIPNPANFSVLCKMNFTIEDSASNAIDLTGLSPDTKILALRTLDADGTGELSDLVDALNWVNTNADDYQIVAITIANGQYTGSQSVNTAINNLISNGIMVIFAAGDNGIESNALNQYASNSKALVVGAVNDQNQLTYYSSKGKNIGTQTSKPDIVAPGGSKLPSKRGIISADTNDFDLNGDLPDQVANDTTIMASTSISAGFVAAAYNLLIETIGGYDIWQNRMNEAQMLAIKSYILMTATETNKLREDDPKTSIEEDSIGNSPSLNRGTKDLHEGYGLLNIESAIEALNTTLTVGDSTAGILGSTEGPNTVRHSIARRVTFEKNKNYLINLTFTDSSNADLDLYLYKNISNAIGEPILIDSSINNGNINESINFGTINETTEYIVVVKAVSGKEISFELSIEEKANIWAPILSSPEVDGEQGFNDTLDYIEFSINYTDKDDIPPILIYVCVNDSSLSGNLTLQKYSSADTDYTDGCIYTGRHRFYKEGTYEYYFGVFDGNNYSRLPSGNNYTLEISSISNAVDADYITDFSNINNWDLGSNWNSISQSSVIDDRGPDYDTWSSLYFGDVSEISSGNYTYETIAGSATYIATSPQILTQTGTNPILQFISRSSFFFGDTVYIEVRANRTGSWTLLETVTAIQEDWTEYEFDLASYAGEYLQIRFRAVLDGTQQEYANKGFMVSSLSYLNNAPTDNHPTSILNISASPDPTHDYSIVRYSAYYCDNDTSLPDKVYLEIEGKNLTMSNTYGDPNATYQTDGENLTSGGILYHYDIFTPDYSDYDYQIHIKSSGIWYKSAEKTGPVISTSMTGIYPSVNNNSLMISYGEPESIFPNIWLDDVSGFHYIEADNTWYCGTGIYDGYGLDWDCNLVTPLIHVPTSTQNEYNQFLSFYHKLLFDPTIGGIHDETATVYISSDYGASWSILGGTMQYTDEITSYEYVSYNLQTYRGEDVFIRFNFQSDQLLFGSPENSGWYIQNISVNIDDDEDRTSPVVTFNDISEEEIITGTFNLNITISDDNSGVDDSSVSVYLDIRQIDEIESQNGNIYYEFDTTEFSNGEHTIIVYAYDNDGNFVSAQIDIIIDNPFQFPTWLIWVLVGVAAGAIAVLIILKYVKSERKAEKLEENFVENEALDLPEGRKLSRTEKKAYKKSQRRLYELEVREAAERATQESEASKPFTLHCKECKKWFKSWDFEWICPNCQNDSLFAAYQCKLCYKWYFKDEPGEYYCNKRNCKIRLLK